MMCQRRFSNCNKCTTQMGAVDNGRVFASPGAGGILLSLYIFTFAINLKIMLFIQSCPTHCIPWGCSHPGFFFHGILQARILQWVAIPFSMETSQPRDQTQVIFVFSYFCCEPKTPLKKLSLKFYFNQKQLRSLLTEV